MSSFIAQIPSKTFWGWGFFDICSFSDPEDASAPVAHNSSISQSQSATSANSVTASRREPEKLKFADSVIKINKRDKAQARHLILTDVAIYNFLPKKYSKCQRRINYRRLQAMVLSQSSEELVFQVRGERDYR